MRKKLLILTVGCKANFADAARIVRMGLSEGFDAAGPGDAADVVVVNGCTVTHKADRDSRAVARRARRAHPGATIVMTGCYAEMTRDGARDVREVDRWVGVRDADRLASTLRELSGGEGEDRDGGDLSDRVADLLLGHSRTFLKIQDGCDGVCSYCVVPLARGPSRSRPPREVVADAIRSEADGAREIVLTGIHIGLYGADRNEKDSLPNLLARLLDATKEVRFRLSSIEPLELSDRLIGVMGSSDRVCRHLHVPLQSGSDRILARMRRPHSAAQFRDAVERAAGRLPGLQTGVDVIAGFPGEAADDFEATLRLIDRAPVHYLHPFGYSARRGTESAAFAPAVPEAERKARVRILREVDAQHRIAFRRDLIGAPLDVLAEGRDRSGDRLEGYSGNYVSVAFPGPESALGRIVTVRAERLDGDRVAGRIEVGLAGH